MTSTGPNFDPTGPLRNGTLGASRPLVLPPDADPGDVKLFVTVRQGSVATAGEGEALATMRWRASLPAENLRTGVETIANATMIVPAFEDFSGTWTFTWSASIEVDDGVGGGGGGGSGRRLTAPVAPRYGVIGATHGSVSALPPRLPHGRFSRMFDSLQPFAEDTGAVRSD